MRKIKFKSREVVSRAPEQENKPEIKKEDVKLSYKVYGQDFSLNDIDYIDYYRTRMKMIAMRFMLVGRIDDKGVYKIKDEIKYDLISMVKEISDEGEDFIRGEAYFMKKYFYFKIEITRDGIKAKASLYLSEFVDDFLDDEYIVSHIADFEDVDDQHFVNKTKEAYNLKDVALKNDELKIPNLAILMQDEYDIDKYIGGLYDIASQIYLMRMLKLLEESGDKTCLEVIKRYKELSIDIDEENAEEDERRNTNKNTRLKALLDRAIDEKGGLEKLNVNKEKLKNIVHEINKSVKAIDGLQMNPAAIEVLRPDSPKDGGSSTSIPKKTAGKSSSKGGGGGSKNSSDKKPPATKSAGKAKASTEKTKEEEKKKVIYTGNPFEAIFLEEKKRREKELRRRAAEADKKKQEEELAKKKIKLNNASEPEEQAQPKPEESNPVETPVRKKMPLSASGTSLIEEGKEGETALVDAERTEVLEDESKQEISEEAEDTQEEGAIKIESTENIEISQNEMKLEVSASVQIEAERKKAVIDIDPPEAGE